MSAAVGAAEEVDRCWCRDPAHEALPTGERLALHADAMARHERRLDWGLRAGLAVAVVVLAAVVWAVAS